MDAGGGDNNLVPLDEDDEFLFPTYPSRRSNYSVSDDDSSFRFYPPLYRQRYYAVVEELKKHVDDLDKVVDFGCAEGAFLVRARNALWRKVRTLIGVDIDEDVLKTAKAELDSEFLASNSIQFYEESSPCVTWLYKGQIGEYDDRLAFTDAVTAIELIEHLEEPELSNGIDVIFSRLRPYLVILTTPNSEFNVLFNMGDRKFRHDDHKFEWTRKEFQKWCQRIVSTNPTYEVQFIGIGAGPAGTEEQIGHASQMAVFRWTSLKAYNRFKEKRLKEHRNSTPSTGPYQLFAKLVYPFDYQHEIRRKQAVYECKEYCQKVYRECSEHSNGPMPVETAEPIATKTIITDSDTGVKGMWFTIEELFELPACKKACESPSALSGVLSTEECFILDVNGFNRDAKMVKYLDEEELAEFTRRSLWVEPSDDEEEPV